MQVNCNVNGRQALIFCFVTELPSLIDISVHDDPPITYYIYPRLLALVFVAPVCDPGVPPCGSYWGVPLKKNEAFGVSF